MRFRATLETEGKTATGINVPAEVVEALGGGKRPRVTVTINGHTYRSSVAVLGGRYMLGVSAENRAAAGVEGGQDVDVELELDTAPREVTVPPDFAAALAAEPAAQATFDGLSYSNKSWHVLQIDGAKADETRQRRIAKSVAGSAGREGALAMALDDRVVAIPGATGAAGRAAVSAFAAEGCRIGLIGTDAEKLRSLAADLELGDGRWHGAAGDVTRTDDVRRVIADISEALGPVDVLVHVVGGWLGGTPAVELDPADVATSFDQHVFSTLHMVQAVVPGMHRAGLGPRVRDLTTAGDRARAARRWLPDGQGGPGSDAAQPGA